MMSSLKVASCGLLAQQRLAKASGGQPSAISQEKAHGRHDVV
jgi:hypothetical protein